VRSEIEIARGQERGEKGADPLRVLAAQDLSGDTLGRSERSHAPTTTVENSVWDREADKQLGHEKRGSQSEPELPRATTPEVARSRTQDADASQPPEKKRGMFTGLKLEAKGERSNQEAGQATGQVAGQVRGPEIGAGREGGSAPRSDDSGLLRATETYARAYMDAARMRGMGLPVVEHQKMALQKAGAALDGVRPGATAELHSALRHDPETRRAMIEKGPERAAQLVAGMDRERQAQLDPNVRAERLVDRWNKLEAEHASLDGREHRDVRHGVETRMRSLAGEIARDLPAQAALNTAVRYAASP
jgi:hypothetical protein